MSGRTHPWSISKHTTSSGPKRSASLVLGAALVATALLALSWGAASIRAESASPAASDSVVLRVGWTAEPDNLNPFVGASTSAYEVFGLNYDQLTGYDPEDLSVRPELATSWEHSADGKVWTFKIRDDVTWQDGEPLTAQDVAFSYNFVLENQVGKYMSQLTFIEPPVRALDDYTVQFTCSEPKATMLSMSVPILPEHLWSDVPPSEATTNYQNPMPIVGSGPFQVVEFKKGSYVRLVANKEYWKGAPKIDEIIFQMYQNPDTMVQDLKSGVIDIAAGLSSMQFKQVESVPGLTALTYSVTGFCELNTNCYEGEHSTGHPALRDPAFRQALGYAIDREKIASLAHNGLARPATSLLLSDYYQSPDWHWEPPADRIYTFDLAKADRLLTEAGYPLEGDRRVDKQGKPITLRLYADTASLESQTTGKLITGWLEDIGFDVDFQVLDEGALFDQVWNFKGSDFAPDFDFTLWTPWAGTVDPDWILSILTTGQIGGWSATGWSNAQYDELYATQQTTIDPEARQAVIWQMQEILYEEMPINVLVYPLAAQAYSNEWEGWVPFPADGGAVIYTNNNFDSYLSVHPRTEEVGTTSTGIGTGAIVAIVVAVLILALVVIWLLRRSRNKAEVA